MTDYDISINEQNMVGLDEDNFSFVYTDVPQEPQHQYGYSNSLNVYRDYIDNIKPEDWKKVRWYINEYDFLVKDPIINRAFYKYWEIINEFELFENYKDKDLILHCAEAPGGFVQGTNIYLQIDRLTKQPKSTPKPPSQIVDEDGFITIIKKPKRTKHDYRIYTISLNKDLPQYKSYNLPSYNRNILNKHICITYGVDETGDINNWANIAHIKELSKSPFYLITADGGFDEGTDFNNKEQLHYCLIFSEIYSSIFLQAKDGHFILKVFDIFTETSVHLMYLLAKCFKEVSVYKPKTSRPTNSEKYIVCKYFRLSEEDRDQMTKALRQLWMQINKEKQQKKGDYVAFKLFNNIPKEFIDKVHYMNTELLKKQCHFLEHAVEFCKDETFSAKYEKSLLESIETRREVFRTWEEQYNLNSYV
jgi:23S rRNA U2552 (ribose-2'-O)-methylase RlmE/FtsJ